MFHEFLTDHNIPLALIVYNFNIIQALFSLHCFTGALRGPVKSFSEIQIYSFYSVSLISQCSNSVRRKLGQSDRTILSELTLSLPLPFLNVHKPLFKNIVLESCPGSMSSSSALQFTNTHSFSFYKSKWHLPVSNFPGTLFHCRVP